MGKQLSVKEVQQLIKTSKPGRYSVSPGLYINISKNNTASWLYRYHFAGKQQPMLGLGAYNAVNSLADMRDQVARYAIMLRDGINPADYRKQQKEALKQTESAKQHTFKSCAMQYIEDQAENWHHPKTQQQWQNSLETYAFPVLGDMPVSDIETKHVYTVLKPIWKSKTDTASRVRSRIERILSYANVLGYCSGDNPALWRGKLEHLFLAKTKTTKVVHHPSMNYKELPQFMARLQHQPGLGAKALMLCILTATRTSEVIGAQASEFLQQMWHIPVERMKAGVRHVVPLSHQAQSLVESLIEQNINPINPCLFPSSYFKKAGEPISTGTMTAVLDRMKRRDITVHGFRATFSTYFAEEQDDDSRAVDMALAHKLKDEVEAAYNRANLIDKRKVIMQKWADFCLQDCD